MELPDGLVARPLSPADARAVFEVVAAAETHDIGEAAIEVEDIQGDWARGSFDLATESHRRLGRRPAGRRGRGLQGPPRRRLGAP